MTSPFLASKTSGFGGRGYVNPFEKEKITVPSVTTVLSAVAAPQLTQWAVDQTCGYYAANPEAVFNRSAEASYYMGRWYWKRTPDFDSPEYDPRNYHKGVLNEAADNGSWAHAFLEAQLRGTEEPTPQNAQHAQMAEQIVFFLMDNDFRPVAIESTVFGQGYAGTLDGIAEINGVLTLFDAKTSRGVYESHRAQLAGLGAAHTMAVETTKEDDAGVEVTKTIDGKKETRWFRPEPLPSFTNYGVLQIRPDDVGKNGEPIDAFCKFHPIPQDVIDASFGIFLGALQIKQAQRLVKGLLENEEAEDE